MFLEMFESLGGVVTLVTMKPAQKSQDIRQFDKAKNKILFVSCNGPKKK